MVFTWHVACSLLWQVWCLIGCVGGGKEIRMVIRFEYGKENKIGKSMSCEWVQLTYNCLRDPQDNDIAHLNSQGYWVDEDGNMWSDIIIG